MRGSFPSIRFTELPLWVWAVGYLEFLWHTTIGGVVPVGIFSLSAGAIFLTAAIFSPNRQWRDELRCMRKEWEDAISKKRYPFALAYALCGVSLTLIFLLGAFSALRPPFLPQEYDAINYQMGVPRQLLIRGSLAWIDWSVADLWPMAMQWGMAPITSLAGSLNKLPQFLFSLGAFGCMVRLARLAWPAEHSRLLSLLPALAFFGAHGAVIQLGTGMMDLPALYLLLLAAACLFDRRYLVAALAISVYVASKAFYPFQIGLVGVAGLAWAWVTGRPSKSVLKRFVLPLCAFSLVLLARPAMVSMAATGTPLFPFLACKLAEGTECAPAKRLRMDEAAHAHLSTAKDYGNGYGPVAFVLHLWRVAVPSAGVNNEYDYPLGLPWLLFLVLLAFSVKSGEWRHPVLLLAVVFWAVWWVNAHQSRWLYPTLAFGLVGTLPQQKRAIFLMPTLLVLSTGFSLISQVRSLKPTFALSASELREKERANVKWDDKGQLVSHELLFVDRPAFNKGPGGERWTFR